MIVKTGKGYVVKSEKGQNLGGPYKTKKEAEKTIEASGIFQTQELRNVKW